MHTPGPWTINTAPLSGEGRVILADDRSKRGVYRKRLDDRGHFSVDDAHLIAAAPDLLEALEFAVARIELANAEGNPILSAWLPDARAAIAKARGE